MTYRQSIQIQIKAIQTIYDNAEGLRDVAFSEAEKKVYNEMRRTLPALWHALQRLDNSLPQAAADYQCKGNYIVTVTETDI
jgi:hypothetical protein